MNTPRTLAALLAGSALLVTGVAVAGVITSATGPILVNGEPMTIVEGEPVEFVEGTRIETQAATVNVQSATGDTVKLEPGTSATNQGVAEGVEYLFIESGAAFANLSDKTSLGGTAGWISAPQGQRATAFLDVQPKRAGSEATIRAVTGDVWVRYNAFRVFVPQQHTVTLAVVPSQSDVLAFRTGQQNAADVVITRSYGGGNELDVRVPKASIGRIAPYPENKTRIDNDITSLKTAKMGLETRFGGAPRKAELGPGTYALIDNTTGDIELGFTPVEFVILDQAVSLTSEFATLAQSNFSDVGVNRKRRR